jgi:cell wall-associated NlpC family hydrolase
MIEQAAKIINEVGARYGDKRIHLYEVSAAEEGANRLRLAGRVLEEENLRTTLTALSDKLPGVDIDTTKVEVLRKTQPSYRWVATNFTSVHASPSWLAEMFSQVNYGVRLELLVENGNWAFARQDDGYLAWVYLPYLTGQKPVAPTHLVVQPVLPLLLSPDADAGLVTRVQIGTYVRVLQTRGAWAEVAANYQGWAPLSALRGLDAFPKTAEARAAQMQADAFRMIGVQYLWGGCNGHGIDCSGLAQLTHRLSGMTLTRDADMQHDAGDPVESPYRPGELVFFGEKGEKRSITHVGVSLGGWKIIHSSRSHNGVYVDDIQAVPGLRDSWLGGVSYITRP